jgi:hypothetical protein
MIVPQTILRLLATLVLITQPKAGHLLVIADSYVGHSHYGGSHSSGNDACKIRLVNNVAFVATGNVSHDAEIRDQHGAVRKTGWNSYTIATRLIPESSIKTQVDLDQLADRWAHLVQQSMDQAHTTESVTEGKVLSDQPKNLRGIFISSSPATPVMISIRTIERSRTNIQIVHDSSLLFDGGIIVFGASRADDAIDRYRQSSHISTVGFNELEGMENAAAKEADDIRAPYDEMEFADYQKPQWVKHKSDCP